MIYRRIKFGDIEGIEIVLVDEPSRQITSDDLFNGDSVKVCFLELEGETLIYDVEVPKLLRVKPPDLRRLAYVKKGVKSAYGLTDIILINNCLVDKHRRAYCRYRIFCFIVSSAKRGSLLLSFCEIKSLKYIEIIIIV